MANAYADPPLTPPPPPPRETPSPLKSPPSPLPRWGTVTLAQKALEIQGAEGTKENSSKAPKAPKLIYTVILWYRFVVRPPPPLPGGGGPSLCDRPPTGPTKGGRFQREGGLSKRRI